MIVNFKTREINRNTFKQTRILILINNNNNNNNNLLYIVFITASGNELYISYMYAQFGMNNRLI
jgi:hypothetical protein